MTGHGQSAITLRRVGLQQVCAGDQRLTQPLAHLLDHARHYGGVPCACGVQNSGSIGDGACPAPSGQRSERTSTHIWAVSGRLAARCGALLLGSGYYLTDTAAFPCDSSVGGQGRRANLHRAIDKPLVTDDGSWASETHKGLLQWTVSCRVRTGWISACVYLATGACRRSAGKFEIGCRPYEPTRFCTCDDSTRHLPWQAPGGVCHQCHH